jgi:hypothetical protein
MSKSGAESSLEKQRVLMDFFSRENRHHDQLARQFAPKELPVFLASKDKPVVFRVAGGSFYILHIVPKGNW